MNPWRWVDPRVHQVRLSAVQAYLQDRGWVSAASPNPQWLRFERRNGEPLADLYQLIPASETGDDFVTSMIYLITTLSEIEDCHPGKVLSDILVYSADQADPGSSSPPQRARA